MVLVGDPEQLQAIEAGAAFRAIAERVGAAEITEVRRQREAWQQQATRELATGRTEAALARYEAAGMVQGHATLDEAKDGDDRRLGCGAAGATRRRGRSCWRTGATTCAT